MPTEKDRLEDKLHELVCSGTLDLQTAQRAIASNWIAAYKKYASSNPSGPGPGHRFDRVPESSQKSDELESDRLGGRMLQLANTTPIRSVHLEQANRCSAYRSASDNDDSVALKVLIPLVLARMKQPDKCAAFRVKPAQVRPLVGIAVVTGQSEVSIVVTSAMLTSDDMLDVISEERLGLLRHAAVFAAMTGPVADKLPEPLIHQAA
jgi:hypothetical protein